MMYRISHTSAMCIVCILELAYKSEDTDDDVAVTGNSRNLKNHNDVQD